jgi:hypothetical protein
MPLVQTVETKHTNYPYQAYSSFANIYYSQHQLVPIHALLGTSPVPRYNAFTLNLHRYRTDAFYQDGPDTVNGMTVMVFR